MEYSKDNTMTRKEYLKSKNKKFQNKIKVFRAYLHSAQYQV